MSLKAQLEAIIYAAETPITLEQMVHLVKDSVIAEGASDESEIKSKVRSSLEELLAEYGTPDHGIEVRQVAGGYRMSTKPEQHEVVRAFAMRALGPQAIKGFETEIEAWHILYERADVTRFEASNSGVLTPFIGREHEMIDPLEKVRAGLIAHPLGEFAREAVTQEKRLDQSADRCFYSSFTCRASSATHSFP